MIFLTKEDRHTWKKYTLNMNKLRINTKSEESNSKNQKLTEKKDKINSRDNFNRNTFDNFLTLLNKNRIEPDGIIDLHGYKLNEAKNKLKSYLFQAFNNDKRNILIITGKGFNNTGLLKKEVPIWLNENDIKKILIVYKNAPRTFGGEGALIIRLKSKQKVST